MTASSPGSAYLSLHASAATAMQRSFTANPRKYHSNARQKRHHSCFLHPACHEGAIEFPILYHEWRLEVEWDGEVGIGGWEPCVLTE